MCVCVCERECVQIVLILLKKKNSVYFFYLVLCEQQKILACFPEDKFSFKFKSFFETDIIF